MQGMGEEQFEEWSDDEEGGQQEGNAQNLNDAGFIQNFINNFNQWRGQGDNNHEEEKKE